MGFTRPASSCDEHGTAQGLGLSPKIDVGKNAPVTLWFFQVLTANVFQSGMILCAIGTDSKAQLFFGMHHVSPSQSSMLRMPIRMEAAQCRSWSTSCCERPRAGLVQKNVRRKSDLTPKLHHFRFIIKDGLATETWNYFYVMFPQRSECMLVRDLQ